MFLASYGKKYEETWVPAKQGAIPPDAFVGGQEEGRQVYVVRFKTQGTSLVPGKLVGGSKTAECAHFGIQRSDSYEVLTSSKPKQQLKWTKTRGSLAPEGAVLVSSDGGYQRYVARIHHSSGAIFLGKYIMPNGVFYYPHSGTERMQTENFEVLCKA